MNFKLFASSWSGLMSENRFLKGLCVLLLGSHLVSLYGWLRKDVIVALVPPTLEEKAEIARNQSTQGYKKAWGLFAAQLLGNVTPDNATFVLESFEDMVSGEIKIALGEKVAAELESVRQEKVSTVFEPRQVAYEPETDKVFVSGRSNLVGSGGKTRNTEQTYEFRIDMHQYHPVITHLASYPGLPKTTPVVEREETARRAREKDETRKTAAEKAAGSASGETKEEKLR